MEEANNMSINPSCICAYDELNADLSELMKSGKLSVFDFPYDMRMQNFVWYHFSLFHICGIVKELPQKEVQEFLSKLLLDFSIMDQTQKELIYLYLYEYLEEKECKERPTYSYLLEFKKRIEMANQKQI